MLVKVTVLIDEDKSLVMWKVMKGRLGTDGRGELLGGVLWFTLIYTRIEQVCSS